MIGNSGFALPIGIIACRGRGDDRCPLLAYRVFHVQVSSLSNFLTIVTEFIGFAMAWQYFGVSPLISVPVGVVGLIAITVTGSFRRWERAMWVCVLVSLLMPAMALIPHPAIGPIVQGTFLPTIRGGITSTALLVIIAIVGTTVAPWQLFFQQSNVIDKRITSRWIKNERIDTIVGAFLTNIEIEQVVHSGLTESRSIITEPSQMTQPVEALRILCP